MLLDGLSAREQVYVEARSRGSIPVAAARIAGFDDPHEAVQRLELREDVRLAIEFTIRNDMYKTRYTREDVLRGFEDAIRMATTSAEVTMALREIAKIEGLYAPTKSEVTVRRENLESASDAELAKMAAIDGEFVEFTDEDEETNDQEDRLLPEPG